MALGHVTGAGRDSADEAEQACPLELGDLSGLSQCGGAFHGGGYVAGTVLRAVIVSQGVLTSAAVVVVVVRRYAVILHIC